MLTTQDLRERNRARSGVALLVDLPVPHDLGERDLVESFAYASFNIRVGGALQYMIFPSIESALKRLLSTLRSWAIGDVHLELLLPV